MSLEKLKSIFNEGIGTKFVDYFQNPPEGFTQMNNIHDSQLAPGTNTIVPPQNMIDTFGEPGTVVDFIQNPPDGFTKNMNNRTDSQLAPGGNIENMIRPAIMEASLGQIGTAVDFIPNTYATGYTLNRTHKDSTEYIISSDGTLSNSDNFPGSFNINGETFITRYFPGTNYPDNFDSENYDASLKSLYNSSDELFSDIRFKAGIGFPSANMKLSLSTEGVQSSLFYINTVGGASFGISGAINKFGTVSDVLSNIGIETPNIPFSFSVSAPNPIVRYQDSVLELAGWTNQGIPGGFQHTPTDADTTRVVPTSLGSVFGLTEYNNETRGNAFQVLGNNSYIKPDKYGQVELPEDIGNGTTSYKLGDIKIDSTKGYIPFGIQSEEFLEFQQINFGSSELYPDKAFLTTVTNQIDTTINWPWLQGVSDFLGGASNKLKVIAKDTISYLDRGLSKGISALFFGVSPDGTSTGKDSENSLIQGSAAGLGGIYSSANGFGNSIPFPVSNQMAMGLALATGDVSTKDLISSVIASQLNQDIQIGAGSSSQQLQPQGKSWLSSIMPFSTTMTDYGGQAQFKSRGSLRSATPVLWPNTPWEGTNIIPIRNVDPDNLSEEMVEDASGAKVDDVQKEYNKSNTPYSKLGRKRYASSISDIRGGDGAPTKALPLTKFYPNDSMHTSGYGDRMTLAPILKGKNLTEAGYNDGGEANFVETSKNGMPFYFKDLRDDSYIIFRGYLEGLTESVIPTWNETNYIGRSESVLTYGAGMRDIAFTFKVAAQSPLELDAIYGKLNKLTSLAYPAYPADGQLFNKLRMQQPLCQLRMGELYGNNHSNMTGVLFGLTYTFEDSSPWEFRAGQRVPKFVNCDIAYRVIHKETPHDKTDFFGYIGTTGYTDLMGSQLGNQDPGV